MLAPSWPLFTSFNAEQGTAARGTTMAKAIDERNGHVMSRRACTQHVSLGPCAFEYVSFYINHMASSVIHSIPFHTTTIIGRLIPFWALMSSTEYPLTTVLFPDEGYIKVLALDGSHLAILSIQFLREGRVLSSNYVHLAVASCIQEQDFVLLRHKDEPNTSSIDYSEVPTTCTVYCRAANGTGARCNGLYAQR